MIRIFLGFDRIESASFHVAAHSILSRASEPVTITPLLLSSLKLDPGRKGATEFTYSRFLVPYLCNYEGYAIYMDCDILCRADVAELLNVADPLAAVWVVKHEYSPQHETKFLGRSQEPYDRKNWSSVMVFNNRRCQALTRHLVDTMPGLWLHQFRWVADSEIGELPREWNHLVGEYPPNPNAKIAHFTLGSPCFPEYRECEFAQEWRDEKDLMLIPESS